MRRAPFLLVPLLLALVACASAAPPAASTPVTAAFDLQAHRGGMALSVESSPLSFGTALDLGVRTLELDVAITADGRAVVTHDRQVNPKICTDTAPATPDDPLFPYAGRYVRTLTLAQLRTLDCGSTRRAEFPDQRLSPGSRIMELREVFELAAAHDAGDVRFNVETKVEAGAPDETAPREQFVQVVAAQVRAAGVGDRVTIQSFDWGALMRMRQVSPELPIVALTEPDFLQLGAPGASPWLGGIDVDAFGGDPVAAAHSFGADALSPVLGDPQSGGFGRPGFVPFTTPDMVARAHAVGMRVLPWTVDDEASMNALLDMGVDGLITNYPDRLRGVLAARGAILPAPHPAN